MLNRFFLGAVLGATLALPNASLAGGFKNIKTKDQFNAAVVDKKITWDGGSAVVRSNGKTDGKISGLGKYYGSWVWNNGLYCRNLVIKKKETGTSCLKVEVSDAGDLRMTYQDGKRKGDVFEGTVK